MPQQQTSLRIAVGIATAGRSTILCETLAALHRQDRRPDRIAVCAPSPDDAEGAERAEPGTETFFGVRGSSIQRNVIIDRCSDCDVVLFLDDDFIMDPSYIANLERLHLAHPDVAMFTGQVIRDGVTTGGMSVPDALAAISEVPAPAFGTSEPADIYNGYGCNMSTRLDLARRHGVRFDENLPLYGWLEDVDFSRSLARYGRIARSRELQGVHLGVKAARQPGTRLGYSQIANPIYILGKGNLTLGRALTQMGRNVSANLLHALRPEPFVDRRGRIVGNFMALRDLVSGRLTPQRVVHL